MNISKQVIILNAVNNGDSIENQDLKNRTLRNVLADCNLSFSEGIGVFDNGCEETAFVVVVNNDAEIQAVKDFAFKSFNQEAILHQDVNQEAYLVFANGREERLGRLEQVPQTVALDKGSYTILDGVYYTTIQR